MSPPSSNQQRFSLMKMEKIFNKATRTLEYVKIMNSETETVQVDSFKKLFLSSRGHGSSFEVPSNEPFIPNATEN